MKKAYIIIISFCAIVVLFSGSYYLSYRTALDKFNKNATEKDNQLLKTVEENRLQSGEETLEVDMVVETVKPSTRYTLETYDMKSKSLSKEILGTPDDFIGLKREEMINYLSDYMREVPLEDYEKGLVSFELISFSSNDIVLRKTYNSDNIKYKYFIIVLDGYAAVYYSDKKTVYEYTDIEVKELSEEEQNKLVDGFYVKDQEELYSILEGYTS